MRQIVYGMDRGPWPWTGDCRLVDGRVIEGLPSTHRSVTLAKPADATLQSYRI